MEEELIATATSDAIAASTLSPEEIRQRADDRQSLFRSRTPIGNCSNCQTKLQGRYCHRCGQVADTFHRPLWSLFIGVFDGLFGVDGRIWQTVMPLLLKPGEITRHYLTGIRKPFIQPFKLFLGSAILFFLTFAIIVQRPSTDNQYVIEPATSHEQVAKPADHKTLADLEHLQEHLSKNLPKSTANDLAQTVVQDAIDRTKTIISSDADTNPLADQKLQDTEHADRTISPLNKETAHEGNFNEISICAVKQELIPEEISPECLQILAKSNDLEENQPQSMPWLSLETRRFLANNIETVIRDPGRYISTISQWAPRVAFVLAPVYGLLLAISFFWRRDLFIYDHMVAALHFHAFLFLLLSLLVITNLLSGPIITTVIFIGWSNFYLYRLHRQVYEQGPVISALRTLLLDVVYLGILIIAWVLLLILGILFV